MVYAFTAPQHETTYCRPEALELFRQQLPLLHTAYGLMRAAIAISLHALDDVDVRRVEQRLAVLSLRVVERSPSRRPAALLANLHTVLFDEEGFVGDMPHYYNALNSYLPAVLNTRRGIPILLSLVYKLVGEGAGLSIEGLNAPGHFMVRVQCDGHWMIVDPFFRGQVLSRSEAFERLELVAQKKLPRTSKLLATATHRQWIARILGNLRQLFASEGRHDDLAAMTEFWQTLEAHQAAA